MKKMEVAVMEVAALIAALLYVILFLHTAILAFSFAYKRPKQQAYVRTRKNLAWTLF